MAENHLIDARKLKGFRDYGPAQESVREAIIATLREEAMQAGFEAIATPALEYADVLLGSGGAETDKETYRFVDHGGRDVALRYDLTVPFARYVAENRGQLSFPFKKVQIGDVWRGEKPQKGRYRQFCQADLDIIGVDASWNADVEVVLCLVRTVARVGKTPMRVALGHRILLSGLIYSFFSGLDANGEGQVLIAVDKLAKIGPSAVCDAIARITGSSREVAEQFLRTLELGQRDLSTLQPLLADDLQNELDRYRATAEVLRTLSSDLEGVEIATDLSIARGLGYYTGVVFEVTIASRAEMGSVCSGGRYNRLLERFGTMDLPGVGGSIGVDRLLAVLEDLGMSPREQTPQVYVAIATEDARLYGLKLVQALRKLHIRTDVALRLGKLGNQFKVADRRGIPFTIVVGTSEKEAGTYSLKNMQSGLEEKNLPWEALVRTLVANLPQSE